MQIKTTKWQLHMYLEGSKTTMNKSVEKPALKSQMQKVWYEICQKANLDKNQISSYLGVCWNRYWQQTSI